MVLKLPLCFANWVSILLYWKWLTEYWRVWLGKVCRTILPTCIAPMGVNIKTSTEVSNIRPAQPGSDELVVECVSGESLVADLVLVGIGVEPNISVAKLANLEVGNGIIVDEFARSSDEHIYAAGDCTEHPSAIFGRSVRLESVQNANDQARVAAANIAGKQLSYGAVPWFWSDQYDVKLQMVGLNQGFDDIVTRGDPANHDTGFALFYLKAGRLLAVDCVKRPKEFMVSKLLIAEQRLIDAALLADENSDPVSWK